MQAVADARTTGQDAHTITLLEPVPKHIRIRVTFVQLHGTLEEQLIEARNPMCITVANIFHV